jgi:LAO/AO transport system kinase
MPEPSVEELTGAVVSGDRRALAKAITLVESTRRDHEEHAERLLQSLLSHAGRAVRVGVSGAPGVGKSTFIEALGLYLVGEGNKVAVLAVDPSSTISGGSILGDKTRMPRLAVAPGAFIRPSPTGGTLGGVARRTREAILICEAAGYDVVLVETVGVGQSELAVAGMVDVFLLLLIAGAGDELQGIKRGIMELADVLCINKADASDLDRATRAASEVHAALGLLHPGSMPAVLTASALEGRGIAEVWTAVLEHRSRLERDGVLTQKRAQQDETWFWSLLREGLQAAFLSRPDVAALLATTRRELASREITATAAARRLLALLGEPRA